MKNYSPGVAKAIAVYDVASNCLTLTYEQNKNNYYILTLQQDRLVVFLQKIVTFTLHIIFKCKNRSLFEIDHVVYLFEAYAFRPHWHT